MGMAPADSMAQGTGANLQKEGFTYDPTMTEAPAWPPAEKAGLPLSISSEENQSNLQLQTGSAVTPYIGAAQTKTDTPEDIAHLVGEENNTLLDRYRLETGVGISLGKQAEVNLGYQFDQQPSLLNQGSGQDETPSADQRFSLGIKLQF